ncbi:hypothetical protein BGZ82_008591 [Podila clonocystis]|nr:hypothetical protein BGZ82_008591 [Podila clonocystis]
MASRVLLSPQSPQYSSHSRSSSYSTESLLYTPPLSPTEEQLLAFLIPDIEPSELAAYLSAPSTPILSDVSCLIEKSHSSVADSHDSVSIETVYPSPVCAAAAATVVAVDRLDIKPYPTLGSSPTTSSIYDYRSAPDTSRSRKRCSTYAFMSADEDEEEVDEKTEFFSSPVFVMSSRNTRKRLMLEQAFVSPDEEEELSPQDCYAQLFSGVSSAMVQDCTNELSSNLAFDLVLA